VLIVLSNKKFITEEECKEGSKNYFRLRKGNLHSNILFELLKFMNVLLPKLAQLCVQKSTRRSTNIGVLSVRTSANRCHKIPVRS